MSNWRPAAIILNPNLTYDLLILMINWYHWVLEPKKLLKIYKLRPADSFSVVKRHRPART